MEKGGEVEMPDREKVIKGLETCYCPPSKCEDCPYNDIEENCNDTLCLDAIALLKEREPKPVKITRNAYDHKFYHCPNCDHDFYDFYKKPNFCEKCGQEVKWE